MSEDARSLPDGPLEAPGTPPPSCTSGLCVTAACADTERMDIAQGCRFYAAQLDNVDSDDGKNMMLVLTNSDPRFAANFRVEVRSPDGWTFVAPQGVIPSGGAARLEVSRPLTTIGYSKWGAFRITSDRPILATQIISDDSDRMSRSSSGTALIPAHALDNHYLALTFPQLAGTAVEATVGSRGGAGVIAVVATQEGTTVHMLPKVMALVDKGIFTPGSGSDSVAVLNEGDVLQVFSDQAGGDLSGTAIDADHPVAVFSGNVFTTYGNVLRGFDGGDMAIEQLPPSSWWGTEYVGARLSPQDGCDPYFQPGGAMWQVLSGQDNNRVTITPSDGTVVNTNNSSFPMGTSFLLNRGQSRVFTTSPDPDWPTSSSPPTGDIVVQGEDGPILLAQWLDCEPGLSLAMDARLGSKTNLTVAFPPGFEQQVIITRHAYMPVQFDGYTIPDGFFQRISSAYDFQVARLTQDQFGECLTDVDPGCQHSITSALAGVAVGWRGVDVVCSYSLTIPSSDPCVVPGPGCVQ